MKQVHRVKDYVRCQCGKLVLKAHARKLKNRWYGPECQKRVGLLPR